MSTHLIEYEHQLSRQEISQLKDEILDLLDLHDEVSGKKKEMMGEFNEILKDLAGSIMEYRTSVETGIQTRTVRCDARKDFDTGMVEYLDVITGEVRDSRPLDAHMRQEDLGIGDQAEYVRILSAEDLPTSCADYVGKIYQVDQRQMEGTDRHCYFRDENGVRRKIRMVHVELYNWEEVEQLEDAEVVDPAIEEVANA